MNLIGYEIKFISVDILSAMLIISVSQVSSCPSIRHVRGHNNSVNNLNMAHLLGAVGQLIRFWWSTVKFMVGSQK